MVGESDFDVSIYFETVDRAVRQGYKRDAKGEEAFKFSSAYLENMETIKREREAAKKLELTKQQEQPKQQEPIDTTPPPEPPTSTVPSRIWTREELQNLKIHG